MENFNPFRFSWSVRLGTEHAHRLFLITGHATRYDDETGEEHPAGEVRAFYAGDVCDGEELAVIADAESSDAIDMASLTLHDFHGGDWLGIHWFRDMPDFDCRLAAVRELLVLYPGAMTFIDTRELQEGEDETKRFLEAFGALGFEKVADSTVDTFSLAFGDGKPCEPWSPPALVRVRDYDNPPINLEVLRDAAV